MSEAGEVAFGLHLPNWGEMGGPATWARVARTAESVGFSWVGLGDHLVFFDSEDSWPVTLPTYDCFSVLSYVAGVTEEIRIGTNVCVVPYRHPVHLAKLALSLDNLSEGRFDFGVGVGWLADEFEVFGAPRSERGSRTDEFLALFERVCQRGVVSFDGAHHSVEQVGFYPRPAQDGGPPIYVGGDASASFRRLAEFGAGWLNSATPPEASEARTRAERAWQDFDRDGEPAVAVGQGARLQDEEADGWLFGPPDDVIDGVQAYLDAGVTRLDLNIQAEDVDAFETQLRRFGNEVFPSFVP